MISNNYFEAMKPENERLQKLLIKFGNNITEFAKTLGISQGSLSSQLKGSRIKDGEVIEVGVSKRVRNVLFNKLDVNPDWFFNGTPPMMLKESAGSFTAQEKIDLIEKIMRLQDEKEQERKEKEFYKNAFESLKRKSVSQATKEHK